jgi:hypothetical protein
MPSAAGPVVTIGISRPNIPNMDYTFQRAQNAEAMKLRTAHSLRAATAMLLSACFLWVAACSRGREIPKYCAVVSTKSVNDDKSLLRIFDGFAASKGFEKFSEDPSTHAYRRLDGAIEVDVIVGLGDLGSFVVFFDSSKSDAQSDKDAVRTFLDSTVKSRWSVRDCAQVKNISPPTR